MAQEIKMIKATGISFDMFQDRLNDLMETQKPLHMAGIDYKIINIIESKSESGVNTALLNVDIVSNDGTRG